MIVKTDIEEFLSLARQHPVLDVRSPGEYTHAHIPGAYSLPLFSDEERKVVGTAYKQESRKNAIKIGLDYFGVKMRKMVEETEAIIEKHKQDHPTTTNSILVHCWRGGMRSAGVAWLLDLYGFKVYTLIGGYKAFRQWTLAQFTRPYSFNVVGGYTGSGKTYVLHELAKKGHQVLDLEGIASHKGSAFGSMGQPPQPSQEMFENVLAVKLSTTSGSSAVWIEDESRRIGDVNLPEPIWNAIRSSPLFFLSVPAEKRLDFIVAEYGKFKKEELVANIMRIRKRLGGLGTKQAINFLLEDNLKECFRILLRYYDKFYSQGVYDRDNIGQLLTTIDTDETDPGVNSKKILAATGPLVNH